MPRVEIYSKDWCVYSRAAKELLTAKGVEYHEIDVTDDVDQETAMQLRSDRKTVPQIFIDGLHIGGFEDLATVAHLGGLDELHDEQRQPAAN